MGSGLPPYKVGNLNSKLFLSEIAKREKSLKRMLEGRIVPVNCNLGHFTVRSDSILITTLISLFPSVSSQLPSPLPRPSCSLFPRFPTARVPASARRNGNIPPPSQRAAGTSAKTPRKGSRSPPPPLPPLRRHLLLLHRYPNSPTWAPAPPLERASPPISSLSAPAARLTSARAAGQEAEAPH